MRRGAYLLAVAAVASVVAGCGGSSVTTSSTAAKTTSTSSGPTTPTGSLTIAIVADSSLNPSQASPPLTVMPAYDPVIYQANDGTYEPDLATSWGFVSGSANKVFQLKIRTGATFTDGSALTAQAVANSLNWVIDTKSHAAGNAGPVKTIKAVNADTVDITYSKPMPLATVEFSLTQNQSWGLIVGPDGIKHASSLSKQSDGVGPYKLSTATAGVAYTYTPNKRYFNQSAIRYTSVTIKPVASATTRLNAVQTGQIQYAYTMPASSIATAKSAGLQILEGGATIEQLLLQDRSSGPLAKLAARQAIEYAINRQPIIKAVFDGVGSAWSSLGLKGFAGYNSADPQPYDYDVAKAKALLKQAGYPNGFTITAVDAAALDPNGTFGQALASELKAVGITLKVNVLDAPLPQVVAAVFSKKYSGLILPFSASDIYTLYDEFLDPGQIGNPYSIDDPQLDNLLVSSATGSTEAEQDAGLAKVTAYLDEQAWSAPVATVPDVTLIAKAVENVASSYIGVVADPFSPVTSQTWYGS